MSYGRPVSRGTLGQAVYCLGDHAVGGAVTWAADNSSAVIIPDDNPGSPVTLVNAPGWNSVQSLAATYKGRFPRVIFSGDLLTNRTLISDGGAGSLGANEFAKTTRRGECRPYLGGSYGSAPAAPSAPAEPPPPPPFTGTQEATVNVVGGGIPANVTVYAADGIAYKLASSSDATNAQELATIAPQGPALKITGRWDPAAKTVSVTSWLIVATGDKKYGVDPETREVVPQRPGIPSTDWPGVPAEYPQESPEPSGAPGNGGAPGGAGSPSPAAPGEPAAAGMGWGLGLLVGLAVLASRKGAR